MEKLKLFECVIKKTVKKCMNAIYFYCINDI